MAKKSRNELYYQVKRGCGLEELTLEQIGAIFLSLERYNGTRERFDDVAVRLVYKQLCDHIDQENESYEVIREKRRQASHARQAVKEKQMMLDSSNDNQMTSNDVNSYQTTSNNHNHNHNHNQNTEPKPEPEPKPQPSGDKSPSLLERAGDQLLGQALGDDYYIENLAMMLHKNEADTIEAIKTADQAFKIDGNYPKDYKNYRMRVRQYVQAHLNDKTPEDNGSNEHNAADLLSKLREQYSRQGVQPEGKISD